MTDAPAVPSVSYGELIQLFLRLSVTAFGGPAAHIAMMEDEIVTRRGWLTRAHYLDLVAATNLIPGPNSTETAIHVGYTLRGIPGAIVAGVCFIVPAFLITLALSALYLQGGQIPRFDAALRGIMPVIVAIVAVVGCRLIPSALKTRPLWAVAGVALVLLAFSPLPEVVVLLGAGVVYTAFVLLTGSGAAALHVAPLLLLETVWARLAAFAPTLPALIVQAQTVTPWDLFWYFLRVGAILFGSGYVLIAYIQQDLVSTYGWLTERQLLDAVAIGQVTPGPVFTTAAAVGMIVAGVPGAIWATVGIFLPAFVFVILSAPLIPRMRASRPMSAFLDGVNAAVVAAILFTVVTLADDALRQPDGALSPVAIALFAATLVALLRFRLNATWMILIGALVGVLLL